MKSIVRIIFVLFVILLLEGSTYSQCEISTTFAGYQTQGMSTTIHWQTQTFSDVICYSSDWQPSFYVNQDSLINVRISGKMKVLEDAGDDDFIGLVFGYHGPTENTISNNNQFYLFDWKRVGQHAPDEFGGYLAREGFYLSKFSGRILGSPITTYKHFWGHEPGTNYELLDYKNGNELGWEHGVQYNFELIYTYKKIIIKIDGEEIFNLDGCYAAGLFGLYTLNQNKVQFSNIKIAHVYDIDFQTEYDDYCVGVPVTIQMLDTACSVLPSGLISHKWIFDDISTPSYELNPSHIFYQPGDHTVDLLVTNSENCTDTITKTIDIYPYPKINSHPGIENCIVGEEVFFSVETQYAEEYQWYYKEKNTDLWLKVQNNSYFNGAKTPNLKVYNIRPTFDSMMVKCEVSGRCANLITSDPGMIIITDIPVRVDIEALDAQICNYDSTTFVLSIEEPYQISKANLKFTFADSLMKLTGYTAYMQNIITAIDTTANSVNIVLDADDIVNIDEIILATFNFKAVNEQTTNSDIIWDHEQTWFIDHNQDTILQFLNNSSLQLYQPIGTGFSDTVEICNGEELFIDESNFHEIIWNNGISDHSIIPAEEGVFTVNLLDIHDCVSEESFFVQIDESPVAPASITLSKEFYCLSDDSIIFHVEGGKGDSLYINWSGFTFHDSLNRSEYMVENPGNSFIINSFWVNTCGSSEVLQKEVEVKENSYPYLKLYSDHEDIEFGDRLTIHADVRDEGVFPNIIWYLNNQLVQNGPGKIYTSSEINKTQEFYVIMQSDADCIVGESVVSDSLSINLISIDDFYIPSLITPNGDGINDAFHVVLRDKEVEEFIMSIFDIRGRLLFSSQDSNIEWVGHGTLPNGGIEILSYYVTFKYKDSNKQTITGKFLLKK